MCRSRSLKKRRLAEVKKQDATSGVVYGKLSYTVMFPLNTRAKTNHNETAEGDSLYSLQQHLESSAFMPPRDITHVVSLPNASINLGGQLRLQPPMLPLLRSHNLKCPLGPRN